MPRTITRRTLMASALLGVLLLNTNAQAQAQANYPSRPIMTIVPQAAGGTNDIVGRLVSQKMGELLGASMAVENRPGAGGNIGTQYVAKSAKDGYTLLMTISSSQAINPALYKNPGFNPVKDFSTIGLVGAVPNVLLVNPQFPAKSTAELIQLAKTKPGEYQYASAGNGTLNHLLGEMLNSMAGIQLQHVPYKGVAPAINDVLGGQLPIVFASMPSALPHIKAGKLRALAVSGPQRSPALPNVPTIAETVSGYNGTLWIGLFAPQGMPGPVLTKLQSTFAATLKDPDLRAKLESQGVEIAQPTSPSQFNTLLQDDIRKWARVVEQSGAKVD